MNINTSDKSKLKDYFPLQCECIETTGTSDGIILKFKTFYLKIYDEGGFEYRVEGYRYHDHTPVFMKTIPVSHMKDFASRFVYEDYLRGYDFNFYQ